MDVTVRVLRHVQSVLTEFLQAVAAAVFVVLVCVVLTGVLDRYLIQHGLPWTEELARYLVIWLALLSAALAVTRKAHYVLDHFYRAILPPRGQWLSAGVFGNAVNVAVAAVLLVQSIELAERTSGQTAAAMQISMGWAYAALPVGFGFITFFYFVELVSALTRRDTGNGADRLHDRV